MFTRKKIQFQLPTSVDTLIIVGNGFDLWQELDTSYSAFEEYYYAHLDEILKKLHLKKHCAFNKSGVKIEYSDVELLYGNPFVPDMLPHSFWSRYEDSMSKLDDQWINFYFGKERDGIKAIRKCEENARRILQTAFHDWQTQIEIEPGESGYRFGNNCVFLNFNYSDTLIKRFHVNPNCEYHIHGDAHDKESIIVGHSAHPEYPYPMLYRFGGRFKGLYYIESALYATDKHVEDNYVDMCMFLALHGVMIENIKKIFVLGHSFGNADIGYFRNLLCATENTSYNPEADLPKYMCEYLDNIDPIDEMNLNIQYAIHNRERTLSKKPIRYPELEKLDEKILSLLDAPYYQFSPDEQFRLEAAAVYRRFIGELHERTERKEKMFIKMLRRIYANNRRSPIINETDEHIEKEEVSYKPAEWYISYYSLEDKARIMEVMKVLGCSRYFLYSTIDECIQGFRA